MDLPPDDGFRAPTPDDLDPEPFDRETQEHTASPSYDATLWLLATEAGRPHRRRPVAARSQMADQPPSEGGWPR